mgnify:CR=1 FL=1
MVEAGTGRVAIATSTPVSEFHVGLSRAETITANRYVTTLERGGIITNNTASNLDAGSLQVKTVLQGTAGGFASDAVGMSVITQGGDSNYQIILSTSSSLSPQCRFSLVTQGGSCETGGTSLEAGSVIQI